MSFAVAAHAPSARVNFPVLDDDGFLAEPGAWDRAVAQRLADHHGLGTLDETHWSIIDFVREKYYRLGAMPPMRNLCRRVGVEQGVVKQAFGGCRQLWQIAGLPHPGAEALSHMR